MSREDRMKAQDVFNAAHFVFGQKVSFDQAFPEIEDITVTIKESGHGVRREFSARTFGKSVGEYGNCSNPLCYKGGVNVGHLIRSMVSGKKTHLEEFSICRGYEGSPKGRRRYRSCINTFQNRSNTCRSFLFSVLLTRRTVLSREDSAIGAGTTRDI